MFSFRLVIHADFKQEKSSTSHVTWGDMGLREKSILLPEPGAARVAPHKNTKTTTVSEREMYARLEKQHSFKYIYQMKNVILLVGCGLLLWLHPLTFNKPLLLSITPSTRGFSSDKWDLTMWAITAWKVWIFSDSVFSCESSWTVPAQHLIPSRHSQ